MKKSILFLLLGILCIPSLTSAQDAVKIFNDENIVLNRTDQEIEIPSIDRLYATQVLSLQKKHIKKLQKSDMTYSNRKGGGYYLHNGKIFLEVETPQGWLYTCTNIDENRYQIENTSYSAMVILFYMEKFDIFLTISLSHYPIPGDESNTLMTVQGDISKLVDKFAPTPESNEEDIKKIVKEMLLDKAFQ